MVDTSDQPQEGWEEDPSINSSADSALQPPFSSTTSGAITSKRLRPVRKKKTTLKVKSLTRGTLSTGLMLSKQEVAFLSRPSAPTSLQQVAFKLGFPTLSRYFGIGGGLSTSPMPTSTITSSSPVTSPSKSQQPQGLDSQLLPSSRSTSPSPPIHASQPIDSPPLALALLCNPSTGDAFQNNTTELPDNTSSPDPSSNSTASPSPVIPPTQPPPTNSLKTTCRILFSTGIAILLVSWHLPTPVL
jgi:hypothetical protein